MGVRAMLPAVVFFPGKWWCCSGGMAGSPGLPPRIALLGKLV